MRLASAAGSTAVTAAMLLTGCSSGTLAGLPNLASSSSRASTSSQQSHGGSTSTPGCSLPLTHETDVGFRIGIPAGWDLSTLNGQIVVGSSPSDSEAVLIYPALLTNGLTAASFFTTYLDGLDQQNANAGTPVTTHPINGSNGLPAVSFTQTVNGTSIEGIATVEVLPLAAPGATQEAAFVSYWAPTGQLSAAANQLSAVAACYGPEQATPARIFQDQVFTYAVPLGWTPMNENANGIDLHGPDGSDVSYLLSGPVQSSTFDSPQGEIAWFAHGVGLTDVTALASAATPQQQTSTGATQSEVYEQFSATFQGAPQRGLIYAYTVADSDGISSGFVRIAIAHVPTGTRSTASWSRSRVRSSTTSRKTCRPCSRSIASGRTSVGRSPTSTTS